MTKALKLTSGETNLMVKYGLDGLDRNAVADRTISNHFGVTSVVNEFAATLYSKCMRQYAKYENGDFSAVRDFDRLKYLMLKLYPDVYMNLID